MPYHWSYSIQENVLCLGKKIFFAPETLRILADGETLRCLHKFRSRPSVRRADGSIKPRVERGSAEPWVDGP